MYREWIPLSIVTCEIGRYRVDLDSDILQLYINKSCKSELGQEVGVDMRARNLLYLLTLSNQLLGKHLANRISSLGSMLWRLKGQDLRAGRYFWVGIQNKNINFWWLLSNTSQMASWCWPPKRDGVQTKHARRFGLHFARTVLPFCHFHGFTQPWSHVFLSDVGSLTKNTVINHIIIESINVNMICVINIQI